MESVSTQPTDYWHVLVEETDSYYSGRRLSHVVAIGADRDAAVAYAARTAVEYKPRHPTIAKSRQVFQTSDLLWTVKVHGVTRAFHFTVQVARLTYQG